MKKPLWNQPWLWLLAGLLGTAAYRLTAAGFFHVDGYPLDDAWIHQTYARNLGLYGQMAFVRGLSSAGSTSPLWTLLLAPAYALGIPPAWWTCAWGGLFLGGSAWLVTRLMRRLFIAPAWLATAAGLFCLLEWHMLWAAASGMETVAFCFFSLLLMERGAEGLWLKDETSHARRFSLLLGLISGALVLTRPEGLEMVGLLVILFWLKQENWLSPSRRFILAMLCWLAGALLLLAPYLWFNLQSSGMLFPNTFYAKQNEYAVLLKDIPLWKRGLQVAAMPWIGGQVLLLPGFLYGAWRLIRQRLRESETALQLLPLAWMLLFISVYALRLPVIYQHGRYQMPLIPWCLLYGTWGTGLLLKQGAASMAGRLFSRTLAGGAAAAALLFAVRGASIYAQDVRVIDSEMVATAQWVAANLPAEELTAAHDIGALGYFANRPLLDLAGLISPEVIPFIRDEEALYRYVRQKGARYLVTFPSWYPWLVSRPGMQLLYTTNAPWAPLAGEDNMAVYRLPAE